jgi:hypothetical protein
MARTPPMTDVEMAENRYRALRLAVDELGKRMHEPSLDTCSICRKLTLLTGKPFGCYDLRVMCGNEDDLPPEILAGK